MKINISHNLDDLSQSSVNEQNNFGYFVELKRPQRKFQNKPQKARL